jgi:uncharacterized protein (DUF433 family)
MKLLERITLETGKRGGQHCIRGKRMRATDIRDLLSHGEPAGDFGGLRFS